MLARKGATQLLAVNGLIGHTWFRPRNYHGSAFHPQIHYRKSLIHSLLLLLFKLRMKPHWPQAVDWLMVVRGRWLSTLPMVFTLGVGFLPVPGPRRRCFAGLVPCSAPCMGIRCILITTRGHGPIPQTGVFFRLMFPFFAPMTEPI